MIEDELLKASNSIFSFMLSEFILREENLGRYDLLFLTGLLSALGGFVVAILVQFQVSISTVVFAALPLVYPLMSKFLNDEDDGRPHRSEIASYFSLFAGQASAFLILGMLAREKFTAQLSAIGATGSFVNMDSLFIQILSNNMTVFAVIFFASVFIGSAGAFILTWNASVLGVFFSRLLSFRGTSDYVSPILYVPHATLEISGFILAGVTGSLVSAALYRKHFDYDTWQDYGLLTGLGISLVITGAFLETGILYGFLAGLLSVMAFAYKLYTLGDL